MEKEGLKSFGFPDVMKSVLGRLRKAATRGYYEKRLLFSERLLVGKICGNLKKKGFMVEYVNEDECIVRW